MGIHTYWLDDSTIGVLEFHGRTTVDDIYDGIYHWLDDAAECGFCLLLDLTEAMFVDGDSATTTFVERLALTVNKSHIKAMVLCLSLSHPILTFLGLSEADRLTPANVYFIPTRREAENHLRQLTARA